ncbi:hypothetical protein BCV72DRAFT_217423 [Rhizopus microsporus var. microsporus]|uniref:CRCB-domain-containing protein n=2 Tax=Rhizopus microsporus TaxID=58291 RepID=A0A2G4SFA3_RHIZD|nr:uncharacterized protein RHIMIDRAFT_209346 [Rhizopus microsporus ATCC 52813]ORE01384.1 hypothetical protein BCV72DRAFT_217423 [Rhizopus microsporus var. microsporus]PHZ07450.1 hypothetical protein RHIMIDRAFT_209346 [Rhizopus microsporus ATCC 52813]
MANEEKVLVVNENKFVIAATIIPFSIAGVLIRIALSRLETYSGAPVFSLVYAQWIGCFIMGVVMTNKTLLFQCTRFDIKRYYPLHGGLSSGLCGSITTFSSWQLGIFKEFANYNANPHTSGKNVLAAISVFLVTLSMSQQALLFGQHIGKMYKRTDIPEVKVAPQGFTSKYLSMKDYLVISFGMLCWIGVVFAAVFGKSQKELTLACVFAPAGALLRWVLSFYNSSLYSLFFVGTFTANILGTIILAALSLLQSGAIIMTPIKCYVLQALADGFCGCLTTISTFMVELNALPLVNSYIYGISSVVVAQCFMFVILGSYIWTQGVHPSAICVS